VLPAELIAQARWIRHTAAKVPVTAWGTAASSTNPATWCDYESARQSSAGVGLGFVLNGDGIVCIDVDHCIVDGELTAQAADLVGRCQGTYIERSPSGTGLHIWGKARLGFSGTVIGGVEVYGDLRYLTVTGDSIGRCRRLAPLGRVISSL
jgi:primase-polymerase (primpol)-like protein